MPAASKSLLERVVRGINRSGTPSGVTSSILSQAATAYNVRPMIDDAAPLSGFDPEAAALFEAIIEAAFLVANSDGIFDDEERDGFRSVVANACNNVVQIAQLDALIADFCDQLTEDGIEKRTRMVARTITNRDHQLEVMRIAALMAHVSGGVSPQERSVLDHLARGFDLEVDVVEHALTQAELALKGDETAHDRSLQ